MNFLSHLLGTHPDRIYKTCLKLYNKAKKKRPGKPEKDYLKLVLLTKPPYDYQLDIIIEKLLEEFQNIEKLASFIANRSAPYNSETQKTVWEARDRNLKIYPKLRDRNMSFFKEFWS